MAEPTGGPDVSKGQTAGERAVVPPGAAGLPGVTIAQLPSPPVAGSLAYVTNSGTATWGATISATGANKVLAWYNGTNWTVAGA